MCWCCVPTCEKCKPKLVTCPACSHTSLLSISTCTNCKEVIPEEAKEAARKKWKESKSA